MRPTLTTPRLVLRPYRLSDAPRVQQLAGEKIIADMTANIPHPYRDGMAEAWIEQHDAWFKAGTTVSLAITQNTQDAIIGTVSLSQIHQGCGNLGYWLGVPFWGQGIATEDLLELLVDRLPGILLVDQSPCAGVDFQGVDLDQAEGDGQ